MSNTVDFKEDVYAPLSLPGPAMCWESRWGFAFSGCAPGLLVGRDQLVRLDAPEVGKRIAMDDVSRAVVEMPRVARAMVEGSGHRGSVAQTP